MVSGHSLKAPLHHQPAQGPCRSPPKSFLGAAVTMKSGRREGCLAQSAARSGELLPSQHQTCTLAGKVGLGRISCSLPPAVSAEATAITTATREHRPFLHPTQPPPFLPSSSPHPKTTLPRFQILHPLAMSTLLHPAPISFQQASTQQKVLTKSPR